MATAGITIDLNEINNIGHPCWEFIDPNPNINQLFKRFHELFFNDATDLSKHVQLEWRDSLKYRKSVGETYPPDHRSGNKIQIHLNKVLLQNRLRKEIIEQLLHEMIHAYLIEKKLEDEDEDDPHGINFVSKMNEINHIARLNITTFHDIPTKRRLTNNKVDAKDKRFMWRCTGSCKNQPPYFGYIWINDDVREPQGSDTMWIRNCEHTFERFNDSDDPKQWLTDWECITIFNKHVANKKVRIKCNQFNGIINDFNLNFVSDDDSFEIEFIGEENMPDELYVNYDIDTKTFINIQDFLPELYETHEESHTVCMICFGKIDEERVQNVVGHLKNCTGIQFSARANETLPILKIEI